MSQLDKDLTVLGRIARVCAVGLLLVAVGQVALLSPCLTEDATYCYWDATKGNGNGTSFLALDNGFIVPLGNETK
jgi:hypothetical protein